MRAAVIALAVVVVGVSTAWATPDQDLERARQAFRGKDCQTAVPLLNILLYPKEQLARATDLVEAHTLLAVCYAELGETDKAKAEFEKALELQPDKSLDELIYSKTAIRVFEETRAQIADRLKRMEDERKLRDELDRIRKIRESMIGVEVHPYYLNFVPFGAGQFQNGYKLRGALLALGQGLTLATTFGTWGYQVNKYGINCVSCVKVDDVAFVRRLQQIQIGTGVAFLVFYAVGVVDAIWHYKAQTRVDLDESLIPELNKKPTPKKTSLRERIRFSPMITPDGVGLGLGWEN